MIELRSGLPRCQIIAYNGLYERECGEPAVARWNFDPENPLYVCEEHDQQVEENHYNAAFENEENDHV